MYQGYRYDCVPDNELSYFSTKTYVVGRVLARTVIKRRFFLAPNYRLNRMSRKTFTILHSKKLCLSRVCCIQYAGMIHLSEQGELIELET